MFKYFKTIKELKKLRKIPVRKEFLLSLRARFADEADLRMLAKPQSVFAYLKYTATFAIVFMFVFSTAGVALAKSSLPGEALYPVKIFAEEVQENLLINSEAKIDFQERRIENRFREMSSLLEKGKNGVALARLEISIDKHFTSMIDQDFEDLETLSFEWY